MWLLSQAWYGNRLAADYRAAGVEHLQALLGAAGLADAFWSLT